MPSFQVRVIDQTKDGMEIETEYEKARMSMMSMSSEQPSFDGHMVQELPSSRVKHVDDEKWEASSTAKKYLARLKKARLQRQKTSLWNQSQTTKLAAATNREARDPVENIRENPKSHCRPNIEVDEDEPPVEKPVEHQREEHGESLYGAEDDREVLFSASTMSDSESLLEEEKVSNTERYHRMINDPYGFPDYSAVNSIPPVVLVSNKSSTSEDLEKNNLKRDNTDTTEENDSAILEKSGSDDSWDIMNKYDRNAVDGQNSTTSEPVGEKAPPLVEQKPFNESKNKRDPPTRGDELLGVNRIDDNKGMDFQPPTEQHHPSPQTKSGNRNNAALDPTMESNEWGVEPQPSFGNVLDVPCDELLVATKTCKKDTVESQEKVSEEEPDRQCVPAGAAENTVAPIQKTKRDRDPHNDFPKQSVLELLMKRAEMSNLAKKKARSTGDDATVASEQLSKASKFKGHVIPPVVAIDKRNPGEEVITWSSSPPHKKEIIESAQKIDLDCPSPVDEENVNPKQKSSESSKALLDSAFKMIARLEKENAEKDAKLRSSGLYMETLEKKLFEDKTAMEEERKRRVNIDSEEVSRLKEKVSGTLDNLNAEEEKGKALQKLVNELKEELKTEKSVIGKKQQESIATKKELLERERNQVMQLRATLAERDQTLEHTKSRVIELEEKLVSSHKRAAQEETKATELRAALQENEAQLEKTMIKLDHTSMRLKVFLDIQNASGEVKRNEDIMEELKRSIESRQKLIDQEEEKKKELFSKQLENASLAEDHQASAKKVEESLEKYYQLIQKEKDEVQRLKILGKEKEEQMAKEKSMVVDIENTIVRKHAMVDLEKVKQKALESSIAQKGRLVEMEASKMREHKALCAERKQQIETEKEEIQRAIQEKEELLCSEKAAIEYLQQVISMKKSLREEKRALEKDDPTHFKYDGSRVAELRSLYGNN